MKLLILGFVLAVAARGQTTVNGGRTFLGPVDMSTAISTAPVKSGTATPGACNVPQMFFETDAAAGSNLWLCTATNTWTQITAGAHTHPASDIVSGTLSAARGGLGADASAFSGMVAMVGGAAYVATAADLPVHTHQAANQGGTLNAAAIAAGTLSASRGGLGADASAFSGVVKMSGGAASVVTGTGTDCVLVNGTSGTCGGGSSSSGLTVSATSTTATVSAGNVSCLDSTGVYTTTALSAATVTRSTGTESGNIRITSNCNSGSPVLKAYLENTLTLANYSCSGITCSTGAAFVAGDKPLALVAVASGTLGTPTGLKGDVEAADIQAGSGLSKTGNTLAANPALVAFLANANTFAAKQTFTPTSTVAGLNIGSLSGAPSAPVNGDMWYDTATGKFRCRQAGATTDCIGAGGGGTPAGSDTQVQFNNAGAFGATSDFWFDNTNKSLVVHRNNAGGRGGALFVGNITGSPTTNNTSAEVWLYRGDTSESMVTRNIYANLDGTGARAWNQIITYAVSNTDWRNVFSHSIGTGEVHIGGSSLNSVLGFATFASSGATRFADTATAGRGLVSIQAVPTELTGQTGNLGAQTLLASSHTAGMYRVCGFVAVTTAGTGSTSAWMLSWRSPASGTDLSHNIFFASGNAATDAFSIATVDEFNSCQVIRSTGASAISVDPGNMGTAVFTTAWSVERIR